MVMYRIVNGEKVKLTKAEEKEFSDDLVAHESSAFDRMKDAKNEEIKAAIEAANMGTFTHGGKVFSCDAVSRSYIEATDSQITKRQAMPPNWPGAWKADDNTFFAINTVAEWNAFYDSMYQQGLANFAHSQDLKQKLAAATTEDEISSISW